MDVVSQEERPVVVITGASKGISKGIAKRFGKAGYRVAAIRWR